MDSRQQLRQWLAELKVIVARMEAELDKHDEDTDRSQAETEAKRRRRGMHSMALLPAVVAGGAAVAKQSPVASAAIALTASAVIGAMVVTHPGGSGPHDTAPGVIAGRRPPAPTADALPPRQMRRPEAVPPLKIRPARNSPAPQPKAAPQTVDLKPVRALPPRRPADGAPMSAMRETADRPAHGVRVRALGLRVRLMVASPPPAPHAPRQDRTPAP